ncbi:MAG TPA: diacylglycerol kinase family protein [Nitrososphaeraceae archaeon]|jgi:diacylglycerol kinase family enzyme|nr:diacylglycerol kinase family protein [Nitrososphaeraceae archaeon]
MRSIGSDQETLVILNPKAASGNNVNNIEVFSSLLKKEIGEGIKIIVTKKAGDATKYTRQHLKKNYKKIIAIGGDGTLNEVANGFFETSSKPSTFDFQTSHNLTPISKEAVLGIIPAGTRNILAKSLNIPLNPQIICKQISKMKPKKIDIISVLLTQKSNRMNRLQVCLNAVEIGLAAEIINKSKTVREKINSRILSTTVGIISTLPSYQSNKCKIILDRGKKIINTNLTMGIVANGVYLAGGFRPAYNASMNDGLLDLVTVNDSGSFKFLNSLIDIKMEDHSDKQNIIYEQVKTIWINSLDNEVTVSIDGEPLGILPANFHIHKGILKVLT